MGLRRRSKATSKEFSTINIIEEKGHNFSGGLAPAPKPASPSLSSSEEEENGSDKEKEEEKEGESATAAATKLSAQYRMGRQSRLLRAMR